jgi:hypothetical protein
VRRRVATDGSYDTRRRLWITGTGQRVRNIHMPKDCAGRPCVVHNPSDHSMRDFKTHLRFPGPWDIKGIHTERICPHGIGHPDPDDLEYWRSRGEDYGVHGCDGCCG